MACSSKDHPCITELYIHNYCIKYAHRPESTTNLVGAYALCGIKSFTSLKGLHFINVDESNMCVSKKVQNYLSEAVFQQKLELSYVPMYHFVHSTCRILYNNVSSSMQKANFIKENQNMKSSYVMFLVRLG